MAQVTVRELPVMLDGETEVGNYFVSNYPPYSFWSKDQVPIVRETLETPPRDDIPLGLYIHIPFCRKRCRFCYFKIYTDQSASQVWDYLEGLARELELYSEKSFLGDRTPTFVYFGGGTPSYLSTNQLGTLTDRLKGLLSWESAEEVAFECEPGTLTETKLRAIRDFGVTRLSLGIEHFDDAVLEINGRAHRSAEIERAYESAVRIGFPQINIDLIAGLVGDTETKWQRCVEKAVSLEPDSVTLYQMEIPFNTRLSQEMRETGGVEETLADWNTKRRWVSEAFQRFESAGYHVSSAYTLVKDPGRTRFLYRDLLWRGADLLSLGVASFSHIQGTHFQNEKDNGPYLGRLNEGKLPIHRAYRLNDEERFRREFILQLKLGFLDRGYFREKFSVDIHERFRREWRELEELGYVELSEEGLTLGREALLRVDGLLPLFFLEEHRTDRAA